MEASEASVLNRDLFAFSSRNGANGANRVNGANRANGATRANGANRALRPNRTYRWILGSHLIPRKGRGKS